MIHSFGQHDPLGPGERLCTDPPPVARRIHTTVHARIEAIDGGDCRCLDCGATFLKNHDDTIVDSR